MQQITLVDLPQVYSFLQQEKPSDAWAFFVHTHGIPHEVLETILLESQGWTGWGFGNNKSWLLFELKDDAMYAKLKFGEVTNVQH